MLYINLRIKSTSVEEKTIEWAMGQGPISDYYDTIPLEVLSVFADDNEYNYLKNLFTNIPFVAGKSCIWRGEVAHFIFDNLR